MTDALLDQETPSPVDILDASHTKVQEMRRAAIAASTDLQRQSLYQFAPLPFLDFDVICGVLPSVAISSQVQKRKNSTRPILADTMVGPATIRMLLQGLTHFCLPPGAVAELLIRLEVVTGKLSLGSTKLVEYVKALQQAEDPIAALSRSAPPEKFADLLFQEIRSISTDLADIELLTEVLRKNVPWRDLAIGSSDAGAKRAFKDVSAHLNQVRSGRPDQNYFDALNVGFVVDCFNTQRGRDRAPWLPILISETEKITRIDLSGYLHWEDAERPHISHNTLYLLTLQALLSRNEGNARRATDECALFYRQLGEISDLLASLLTECKHTAQANRLPLSEINLAGISQTKLELLQLRRNRLVTRWKELFLGPMRSAELDRAEYLDHILTPSVHAALSASQGKDFQVALDSFVASLRKTSHPLRDLWQVFESYSMRSTSRISELTSATETVELQLFEFSVADDDGSLLTDNDGRTAVIARIGESSRPKRLLVRSRFSKEVLIAGYRDCSDTFTIAWPHRCDKLQLWAVLQRFCQAVDEDQLVMTVFSIGGKEEFMQARDQFTNSSAPDSWLEDAEYVEIEIGGDVVFADLRLLYGREKQFGLVRSGPPGLQVGEPWINRVSEALRATSTFPLRRLDLLHLVLRRVLTVLIDVPIWPLNLKPELLEATLVEGSNETSETSS